MSSSNSGAPVRLALLAFLAFPGWACATAINAAPSDSSPLGVGGSGSGSESSGGSASEGGSANSGSGGVPGAAGNGVSGSPAAGSPGSAGKGGSGSGGAGSAGSTGKAGASSAGSPSGGASTGGASAGGAAGSSSAGSASVGGASAGTTGSAGSGEAGGGSGITCDAAHATVTFNQQDTKDVKANDCVHLVVNPGWATVQVKLQAQPGTATYPVPFSFVYCGGNGTGSLTGNYVDAVLKSGPNPGCDVFVQFTGGDTAVKVTYFD
ncbi:MAG TPA: hypothetical protein VFK05_10770 [Polyangiaceae bacterium]|nr:hypothetical protein [Polyangiaceae bacterium]